MLLLRHNDVMELSFDIKRNHCMTGVVVSSCESLDAKEYERDENKTKSEALS